MFVLSFQGASLVYVKCIQPFFHKYRSSLQEAADDIARVGSQVASKVEKVAEDVKNAVDAASTKKDK